jgi:hypothetical protein
MKSNAMADETPPSRSGHHPEQAAGSGWDAGELVATTAPGTYGGEVAEHIEADAQSIIAAFLRMMTTDAPALLVGQRVMLLAYLTGQTDCKTSRELATRLNVTPARVSQILRTIPQELASLCRLKSRTAKRRRIGRE